MDKFCSSNKKLKIDVVCPVLELKRYFLINNIKHILKKNLKLFFNKNKLNNVLSRWLMSQLTKYYNEVDPFIPCNYNDIEQLKRDIINIYIHDKKKYEYQ